MKRLSFRLVACLLVPATLLADPVWRGGNSARDTDAFQIQALGLISLDFTPSPLWTLTPVYEGPLLMSSNLLDSGAWPSGGSPLQPPDTDRQASVERALRYAAEFDGKDFVGGFYSPKTPAEIRAYLYLMNFSPEPLLDRLQTATPQSAEYHHTLTALAMNHRLVDFHLLREQYTRWESQGDQRRFDLLPVMRQVIYQGRLLPGGTGRYYLINQRTYPGRDVDMRDHLVQAIRQLQALYPDEEIIMQDWAFSDGTLTQEFSDYLKANGLKGITINSYDKSTGFTVLRNLFPPKHRFAGYTFVFDSDGRVTQSTSPDKQTLWVRWQLSDYLILLRRLLFKNLMAAFAHTQVGSRGMSTEDMEEVEQQYQAAKVSNALRPADVDEVSTISPEVETAVRKTQGDIHITLGRADIFELPLRTPEKSIHIINIPGLLMRNNEYFALEDIKRTLGELGRTLKEDGILVNWIRGSKKFPEKLYLDAYQRVGNELIRLTDWPGAYENNDGWDRIPIPPPSAGSGGAMPSSGRIRATRMKPAGEEPLQVKLRLAA